MKITKLHTRTVEFPYDPVMGLSPNYQLRTGSCVLVFLESDQGAVGEGLVYTFNGERLKLYDEMVQSFAPLVTGADPTMSGSIFARAWAEIRSARPIGISP